MHNSRRKFRTGLFEIDLEAGQVSRQGRNVRVQDQPFRLLTMLLDRPGELVSREEIRARLWPADTFVSFDDGLNTAIRKLRVIFGDSADNPRFIETAPRKGYRFIAPVTEVVEDAESSALSGSYAVELQSEKALGAASAPPAGSSARLALASSVIVALCLICWLFWRGHDPEAPFLVSKIVQITNDGKAKIPVLPPVTDGVHLYFVEGQPFNSGSGIAQMSASGGETTWITTNLRDIFAIPSISPDGTKLLVAAGASSTAGSWSQFWIQPLPAGNPYRVGQIVGISGCFTPDGTHILYGNDRAVKIVNLDGSDPRQLAIIPGIMRAPHFSPDGKRVRFWLSQPEGNATSIWEMKADGSNLHQLFTDWKEVSGVCCGSWSPDGDYYFFQASLGSERSIWVLPERRSFLRGTPGPFRLISGPLHFGAPGPSVDGKRLFVLGETARVELFRYDLKAKRFDPFLGGLSAGPVDFSPDGNWIAYVSYPDMTLWRSRLDFSEKMQLTFAPVTAFEPRWSPDGTRIAFMDVRSDRPWTISVISAGGGDNPKSIEPLNQNDSETDPNWTGDGKSIVFSKGSASGKGAHAIYYLNLENAGLLRVPGSEQVSSPRLSPDGKLISAIKLGQDALMLFDVKTHRWSTLATGERFSFNQWSRDGKYVYMRADRAGAALLVRVRIKDHRMEDILDLKDFPALVDRFANSIGLTPDGGVLLMRDRSVQEIYALSLERR